MLFKYGNCTRLLKIKNKLKIGWFLFSFVVVCICFVFCCCCFLIVVYLQIGCFYKYSWEEFSIFCGRFQ